MPAQEQLKDSVVSFHRSNNRKDHVKEVTVTTSSIELTHLPCLERFYQRQDYNLVTKWSSFSWTQQEFA